MAEKPDSLGDLLRAMTPDDGQARVSVADILDEIGDRSFAPAILIPALILVSPVSGVPGTPTLGALIILSCALQGLVGRRHLWLPGVLRRRSLSAHRMCRAIAFLQRPAAWIDRHSQARLHLLTGIPLRQLAFAMIAATALTWPFLELLPFVTSFGAGAVSLIAFGLMTRDGAYVLAGYVVLAVMVLAGAGVVAGVT
ncbi:exopolysaccharide biosynthesis protein [Thalassococcus sp. CAU 1522]|uniref:Exopolysaccharide biosynthesis protein n=1 Tax=Thalassococcus arenae TaxID=2851652 RepID=A0ABS6N889_9RHOB|nr:exopolysaccharide biosynthesis protein [Thalassococcus arenae]MBV2360207.1 exopolysaccharide biosynthesis protein [Thalassococcus arenae]